MAKKIKVEDCVVGGLYRLSGKGWKEHVFQCLGFGSSTTYFKAVGSEFKVSVSDDRVKPVETKADSPKRLVKKLNKLIGKSGGYVLDIITEDEFVVLKVSIDKNGKVCIKTGDYL